MVNITLENNIQAINFLLQENDNKFMYDDVKVSNIKFIQMFDNGNNDREKIAERLEFTYLNKNFIIVYLTKGRHNNQELYFEENDNIFSKVINLSSSRYYTKYKIIKQFIVEKIIKNYDVDIQKNIQSSNIYLKIRMYKKHKLKISFSVT